MMMMIINYCYVVVVVTNVVILRSPTRVTRNSSGDEIYSNVTSLYSATPLVFNATDGEFPSKDYVKFSIKVKGWLRYEMAKNCQKFQPLSRTTNVTASLTTDEFAIAKTRT